MEYLPPLGSKLLSERVSLCLIRLLISNSLKWQDCERVRKKAVELNAYQMVRVFVRGKNIIQDKNTQFHNVGIFMDFDQVLNQ